MAVTRELCPLCNRYKLLEQNGLCNQCHKEAIMVANRLERAYEDIHIRYLNIEKVIERLHLNRYQAIYVISAQMCDTPYWREQLASRVCPLCDENPPGHDSRYCPFCRAFLKAECTKAISELLPRCSPRAIYKVELITSEKWRSAAN